MGHPLIIVLSCAVVAAVVAAPVGLSAAQCKKGSWNPAGSRTDCTKCDTGLTTADTAANQADASDCKMAPGYGFYNGATVQCPVGEYRLRSCSKTRTALSTTQNRHTVP
jgi:hypothetical protein